MAMRENKIFRRQKQQIGSSFGSIECFVCKSSMNMRFNEYASCFFQGDSYPNLFAFNFSDSSLIFEVPRLQECNLKAMMCVVYSSTPKIIESDGLKNMLVINYTKAIIQLYKREALVSFDDEE
ncbi:hypothetical protein RYX36_020029, partial [Vicia faba]